MSLRGSRRKQTNLVAGKQAPKSVAPQNPVMIEPAFIEKIIVGAGTKAVIRWGQGKKAFDMNKMIMDLAVEGVYVIAFEQMMVVSLPILPADINKRVMRALAKSAIGFGITWLSGYGPKRKFITHLTEEGIVEGVLYIWQMIRSNIGPSRFGQSYVLN